MFPPSYFNTPFRLCFKKYDYLLGVLPPTSRSLLPTALQSLMVDPASPLLAFYPEDFQLDQNEKKQDWEAIVLLPFIDEQLLLNSITKCYNQLDSTEQFRNQHLPSLCFQTSAQLHPIGNSLGNNPYFPLLKETRASCKQFPIDYYQLDNLQIKHDRFEDKDMIIFPKFPILNVLSYKYGYKSSAVSLFESRSRATTLVINLTHQPDLDCITYNNQWNPKDENYSSPFQITNRKLLIERYLGKRVFVNWPHFQYGIVCAISDFQHLYTWVNIPGGSNFGFEPINNEEQQDFRNYSQPPLYVSDSPFEIPIENNKPALCKFYPFDEIQTQLEYTKAIHINRNYENRQGISIGPIPILLYVSPLIGYRTKSFSTSDKCRTTMCFSNQASAYPLQTTLFILPNYKYEYDQIPQTITDYFQIDDRIFALQPPYYSSLGYIQQINQDNHGKYSISCRMESSGTVNQPDVQQIIPKLGGYHLKYFTAQRIAERLKTAPCVISKITGKINVIGGNKRRGRANPTNIGLAWKVNKPVKQVNNTSN
jgi:5'-3' exoribonuclease 1